MAAALASKLFIDADLKIDALSAGINASPDHSASTHALTVMDEEGCDLQSHRSQRVTKNLISQAKLILTMTSSHRTAVLSSYPEAFGKNFSLCEYAGCGQDVSDPFGGDYKEYRACATQIKDLLHKCVEKIKEERFL
jgi:protein-tyrosine-phosphatase